MAGRPTPPSRRLPVLRTPPWHYVAPGPLATLPFALTFHATVLAHAGELTRVSGANVRGEGTAVTIADLNLAILHNGLGGYAAALDSAQRVWESGELAHSTIARIATRNR